MLVSEKEGQPLLEKMWDESEMLRPQSHWLIGGDGWAYDIGYGGLDHVISKGENINVVVLDTEMYSNTGGQVSKSTPQSAVVKFATMGNRNQKKDLGAMAMTYEKVYVASIAMGANYNQTVQAFKEAQQYDGTSLILAYSPCIDWGIDMKYMMEAQKLAVDSGYWNLYRFNPSQDNPLTVDSKKKRIALEQYLSSENRYQRLVRADNSLAHLLHGTFETFNERRAARLKRASLTDLELMEELAKQIDPSMNIGGEKVAILYASETGTAEQLAGEMAMEFARRDMRTNVSALDDFDLD
eukprot:UN24334